MPVNAPAEVHEYQSELVRRLEDVLGDELLGVYSVGSLALGGYRHGSSDIDVIAITANPVDGEVVAEIARQCSHSNLRCPARKLELVVMPAAEAKSARAPRWQLNLNTGRDIDNHVGTDASGEPEHWFILDKALAHAHAVALRGPHAAELITAPAREAVERAQAAAIAWFAEHEPGEAVLVTAARAWHWQETGRFASKPDALSWVLGRLEA